MTAKKKLYCYVDETGQDARADVFIVVVIATFQEQEMLRKQVEKLEDDAKLGKRKWHKAHKLRRVEFLERAIERSIGKGDVFYRSYQKPLPYFLPLLDAVAATISAKSGKNAEVRVFVDGIDRKKARELTNGLRVQGVRLGLVKGKRDESEPLIRLADRWAGCIRLARSVPGQARQLVERAKRKGYLQELKH